MPAATSWRLQNLCGDNCSPCFLIVPRISRPLRRDRLWVRLPRLLVMTTYGSNDSVFLVFAKNNGFLFLPIDCQC